MTEGDLYINIESEWGVVLLGKSSTDMNRVGTKVESYVYNTR